MPNLKSSIALFVAILFGVALGAFFTRPPHVKAAGDGVINVHSAAEGQNVIYGQYAGFACTSQTCYIASRQ